MTHDLAVTEKRLIAFCLKTKSCVVVAAAVARLSATKGFAVLLKNKDD